jgi:glycosyltransferase involved in cell wall biosynthesis
MNFVIQFYSGYYASSGGIETHITDIVRNLNNYNFEIVTDAFPNHPLIEKINSNVTVKRIKPVNGISSSSKSFDSTKISFPYRLAKDILRAGNKKRYLQESEYDLLHVHGMNSENSILRLSFILQNDFLIKHHADFSKIKKPKIITVHGLSSLIVNSPFIEKIENEYLRQFENIICVDDKIFRTIESKNDTNASIHYIPNGVDCSKFKYKKLNNTDRLQIGFIGRLEKSRGIDFLVDLVKNKPEKVDITVIGAGNYKEIKRFLSIENMKSIRFLSNIKYDLIPNYIHEFDILFNPVIAEGISRVTLESMACGRPVIMLNKGNRYPIVHGKTGYLFNTSKDLLELIEFLGSNKEELIRVSKEARRMVEDRYSHEVILPQIDRLYSKVI